MAFNSTFGAFTSARLGIYASQKGLQVTGNNIANINTIGYTRQRLDQRSLKVGAHDRYQTKFDVNIGNGALCTGVSQIRDPYLDIRYRSEMASVGAMEAKLNALNDLASVLDEVGKNEGDGVVGKQLADLEKALHDYSLPGSGYEQYDSLVRSAASKLVNSLNYYANKLEEIRTNAETDFKQDFKQVNEILSNIRDLNEEIRLSDIHGDKALEQRDARNLLIDELSKYMKIDVTYTTESIGGGQYVEKLVIKLGNANPDPSVETDSSTLVDGIYATQLSMPERIPMVNPKYDPTKPWKPGDAVDETTGRYIKKVGNPTATPPTNNEYTNDLNEAIADGAPYTENENRYLLQLDQLKDSRGELKPDILLKAGQPNEEYKYKNETVYLDDNDLYGSFQSKREMLTEKGEFASTDDIALDEYAATKRGIPYYQKALDALANKIATVFNNSNRGYMVDENGYYLSRTETKDADGNPVYTYGEPLLSVDYWIGTDGKVTLTDPNPDPNNPTIEKITATLGNAMNDNDKEAMIAYLKGNGFPDITEANFQETVDAYLKKEIGEPEGCYLFTTRGDLKEPEGTITAANISISFGWSKGTDRIVQSFIKPTGLDTASKDNSNINHLAVQMKQSFAYTAGEVDPNAANKDDVYFNGNFYGMLANISSILANDGQSTSILLENFETAAVDLDSSRDGVSGVDLNDEAMSLMQYQKSYSAACRLMTAIDETLERLINNTGIVGR